MLEPIALAKLLLLALALVAACTFAVLYFRIRSPRSENEQAALGLEATTQAIPAGIWRTDAGGNCLYANTNWEKMSGQSEGAWRGSGWADAMHRDDRVRVFANFIRCVARGKSFEDEWRWQRPEGTSCWTKGLAAPEYDDAGNLTGFIGVNFDIQHFKDLEKELKAARDIAQQDAASKSAFLANMSHDIRTPMNGVVGFTELLLETELDEAQREQVRLIADSGRAMVQLLNDILDHAKIESGQLNIILEPTDLRQRLAHCTKLVEPVARSKGLSISVWVDDGVPQYVELDQLRIGQVLLNLVGNAVKFTESGGIDVEARLENSTEGQSLLISVIDTGIGIEEDRLEVIFTPFVQEDGSTATRYGGSGLGLAISSQLITMMDGQISVHSRRGVGTQFTVRLPLQIARARLTKPKTQSPRSDGDALSCLAGAHVLIAEDHGINQELIMAMANSLNLDAVLVEDGEEAVAAVIEADDADLPFDAVLMDMQMPGVDGLEATRRLRALGYDAASLPIVALTANCYPDDIAACTKAGMQSHLGKPVTTIALARELSRWLGTDAKLKSPRDGMASGTATADLALQTMSKPSAGLQDRYYNRKIQIVSELRETLKKSPDQTDWEELARQLHKLAGVAANFGEPELGEASRRLERWLNASRKPEELMQALKRDWPIFEKAA